MTARDEVASPPALLAVWRRQRLWSKAADQLKGRVVRTRRFNLVALMVGALGAAGSAQLRVLVPGLAHWLALAAAVAVGLGAFVRARVSPTAEPDWARARVVSETLKAEIYLFLAGVAPYRDRGVARLIESADRICATAATLDRYVAGLRPDGKELPAIHDVRSYLDVRVTGQIDGYYRAKARKYAGSLKIARGAEIALAAGATVLGIVAGFSDGAGFGLWIGVLTTIAAAVAAHAAQSEYEYLMIEYSRTANRLETLSTTYIPVGNGDPADDELVAACERVLLDQNGDWLLHFTNRKPDK